MKYLSILFSVCLMIFGCSEQRERSNTGNEAGLGSETQGEMGEDLTFGEAIVDFPVSCDPAVQPAFNAALASIHNMTYHVAREQFQSILEIDPGCGMAQWGIAMTYIHPLWSDSPSESQIADATERITLAREAEMTVREKAYVDALAVYYENVDVELYERLKKFASGMEKVHRDYPDDLEAKAFYAVTHLSTMPPGVVDMTIIDEASTAALEVLAAQPDHPGGHHYVIHAFDYPGLAERAVEVARSYSQLAPENPHALHMPSHIFTRLGMWDASIELNTRSAAAALTQPFGDAISVHYPHALDYLLYAYIQTGQEGKAQEIRAKLDGMEMPIQVHPASAYHLAAADARWMLERHDWEGATAITPRRPADFPWDDFPQFEALSQFAVALGGARSDNKRRSTEGILALIHLEARVSNPYWKDQVKVMRLASQAWLHEATGNHDKADSLMAESAALEAGMSKHAITPGEILPSGELLGDLLMIRGRYSDALSAYESALERTPNRFNSLYGAGRAAEEMGDSAKAREYYQQLVSVCHDADTGRDELAHARAFSPA